MMTAASLAGVLLWQIGYRPRHRLGRLGHAAAWTEPVAAMDEPGASFHDAQAGQEPAARASSPRRQHAPDLLGRLTGEQLRQLLEGCALNDMAGVARQLVEVVGHSSHTGASLLTAWRAFRGSVRQAHELHMGARLWSEFFSRDDLGPHPSDEAVALKLREADHAWSQITNGVT
jgi:hypothetical protein